VWDRDWQAEIRLLQKREQRARDILSVPETASMDEIKRAWRRESLKHHPDHHGGSIESRQRFILIHCAYRYLAEGRGGEELDSKDSPPSVLIDGKYQLDNPWGYWCWWRDKYFDDPT